MYSPTFYADCFHICFRFFDVTIVDCMPHIGWTRALVTLKCERQLLYLFGLYQNNESINEIKQNFNYHVL
ncbi:hypothetical protein Hanom_Chr05g00433931 [Helianthus anomalus]